MKANRFWIETIALGTSIACACAVLIALLAAATATFTQSATAAAPQNAAPSQTLESTSLPGPTFEGMITCSRCGAKHSAAMGKTASDCTRECVHGGAAFALVDGERMYVLEGDLQALKKVAGQRVTLAGALHGNTIHVSSITKN